MPPDTNQKVAASTGDMRLTNTELAMIHADKLESLGRLAAGVAHEVRNPLAILQMGVECLSDRSAHLDPDLVSILAEMKEAIARADAIVREMVSFAGSVELDLKLCSINSIVERAILMLRPKFATHRIKIDTALLEPLPFVLADAAMLEQVLMNLMMNSIQAMNGSGTLMVRTYAGQIDEVPRNEGLRIMDRLRPGDSVVFIEVRDQGSGIPDHLINRVFDPFFTTKPAGEGTGLGLSVAARIVDLHRGHLQLSNVDEPRGLLVRIILKACDRP